MDILSRLSSSDNRVLARAGFWLSEIYRSRHMLLGLVERDFKGRYRNSVLGYLWHAILPVILILIYYLVFNSIFGKDIRDYWAYLSLGVFSFTFFLQCATGGMNCVVGNKGMVTKMYFPREILVFSAVINALLTFIISYVILISVMAVVGVPMDPVQLLFVPAAIVIESVFSLGVAFLLGSVCVYSHDVMYAAGRILPFFMFVTPIMYTIDIDNSALQVVMAINPLTYYVEMFHDSIYYGMFPDTSFILVGMLYGLFFLMLGFYVFKRLEKGFAERLRWIHTTASRFVPCANRSISSARSTDMVRNLANL